MFAGAYSAAPAFDKVKYGVLNITADMHGVHAALGYGDSYMRLATAVRARTTFAFADTGGQPGARATLATCEHYAHVLTQYPDADLKAALAVGCGRRRTGASGQAITTYKEMQVRGLRASTARRASK